MNIGNSDQGESHFNNDLLQHRELPRDNLSEDSRHGTAEREDSMGLFVDQGTSSPSAPPEAEQHDLVVLDDREDDPQGGGDQQNDDSDPSEQSGSDEVIEDSELEELEELIEDARQDVARGVSKDTEEESNDDQPENNSNQGRRPDCASCKVLRGRIRRLNKRLASKLEMLAQKNARLGQLLPTILRLRQHLKIKDAENRRLRHILRRNFIDPNDNSDRLRSVPNPNAFTRAAPGAWKHNARNYYNSLSNSAPGERNLGAWEEVWKAQYKQSNISVNLNLLHPDIRFKQPEDDDTSAPENLGDTSGFRPPFDPAPLQADFKFFDKLPTAILIKILNEILLFSGQVVHIFGRLDPYSRPADYQTARRVPGRIYVSDGKRTYISLTRDTLCPRNLLSPLCVNRKWYFFGAHIFYGTNTFGFSSFGEFGRFCKGIGPARLQRIANLEIHWQGGTCVGFAEEGVERDWRRTKEYRIMPIAYLLDMRSLDTLVIFIDESPMRRPWEDKSLIQYALKATERQPNQRSKRALRVCRGWDYLHMLRNLSWIRLYDTARMNENYQRNSSAVKDRSAVEDLNRTARMENTPDKAEDCRLDSLQPLIPYQRGKWAPGEDDYRLILSILDRPQVRTNDLDDYDRGTDGEDETGSDRGSESESDSSSSSDDGDEDEDEDENGVGEDAEDSEGDGDGGAEVRAPGAGCDNFDLREDSPRPKSEGGFGRHSACHIQRVVIEDDPEDDIQIIEPSRWRFRAWRSASATDTRCRRDESTKSDSSMFVTPHPGERSTVSATVSPNPRTVIDLTRPDPIKRSASSDPAEAKKKKIKVDT